MVKTIIQTTEAEFYFCGAVAFMKHINAALTDLGVKQEHIHYEFFGPATSTIRQMRINKNEVFILPRFYLFS